MYKNSSINVFALAVKDGMCRQVFWILEQTSMGNIVFQLKHLAVNEGRHAGHSIF